MNLTDAVSGRAGLAGIRWLLLGSKPRDMVRRELSSLLSAPERLGACHLRHAKFRVKPDVKLSAYYDVDILGNGSDKHTRAIAVTWKPKWMARETAARWVTPDITETETEALRLGVAAPFHRLTARVSAWGLHVQISPLDVSFPQLVPISDPGHVRCMLARAKPSDNDQSADKAASRYAVTSIKYQPGQRHTLRYDSTVPNEGTVFAKAYNRGEGSRHFQVALQAADWISEHLERATCLRPLAYLPEDDVVLYPLLSGTPLHESLPRREHEIGEHLELAGRALGMLHQAPQSLAELCPPWSLDATITDVERKCDFVPMLLPSVGPLIRALIDRARVLYEKLPQEQPTFTHGDFKIEHLWETPEEITVIDLDAAHLADPAMDVGRFLADLALWFDIWRQPGFAEARGRFMAGYATVAPGERLVRAGLFEALDLILSTGRRLSFFDGDWEARATRLIRRATLLLNHLDGAFRQEVRHRV